MAPQDRWRPSVTVAAVISNGGGNAAPGQPLRYLLVEEHTPEGLRLNNPAGHLDPGESPEQGVVRETLEETARLFTPEALVGIYLARFQRPGVGNGAGEDITYLRLAYCDTVGDAVPGCTLDTGIVRTLWLTVDEIRASVHRHRSPLVLQCVEDHLGGQRHPLAVVSTDASVFKPAGLGAKPAGGR